MKNKVLEISYEQANSEEAEEKIARAFSVIFEETIKTENPEEQRNSI